MIKALTHRGPDGIGVWTDGNVGFAHSRLSILDLSFNGHQPMIDEDGRYVLVFNGEIYNYKDLHKELANERILFELHGDTQVLLKACIHWGVNKTLQKLNGMFAFAFYDCKKKQLWVARDRFGEKPLYYTYKSYQFFAFASELKALRRLPQFTTEIDEVALQLYLQFGYVPCPYSIYKDTMKLFPGHYLIITEEEIRKECYYDLESVFAHRLLKKASTEEITNQLDSLLQISVAERMRADVSVGTFLSGGIDSSLITALMQKQSLRPIKTFTVGYKNDPQDESKYAEAIAKYLRTDHTTINISKNDLQDIIISALYICDEPFADPAILPLFYMSKIARQSITVALTGDGGDELFTGYRKYKYLPKLYLLGKFIPNWTAKLCQYFYKNSIKFGYDIGILRKINRTLEKAQLRDFFEVYLALHTIWTTHPTLQKTHFSFHKDISDLIEQILYCDLRTQFTDMFLCKSDRASMAASLEIRAPIIDYNIFDFAVSVPVKQKICHGIKKYLLKRVLNRYMPKKLWDRHKMGFKVPLAEIFQTSLRPILERYKKADTLIWKYLDPMEFKTQWQQYSAGNIDEMRMLNFFVMQQFLLRE